MERNENDMSGLLTELCKLGVCKSGRRYLERTEKDFDTLVKVWRGWPEFLTEHAEKALPLLRGFLTPGDRERLADRFLFVDHTGVRTVEKTVYPVFVLGDSDVMLELPDYAVVKLYVFNNALVTVNMGERAILNIETYGNSEVRVRGAVSAKSTCYRYDDSTVSGVDEVRRAEHRRGEVFNGREMRKR
ncbi:MAG: hypothetical protein NC324_03045 [Bacteroides sp.]|nr:hypothetical protein [Bacteroides sp.]